MAQITYADKSDINTTSTPAINKVSSADMNEIKSVVNTNDSNVGTLSNLDTTDKTSIVNAINELCVVELFSNDSGETGTIVLSDDKTNYKYIEIIGRTNGGAHFSTKLKTDPSTIEIFAIDDNSTPGNAKLWLKWGRYTFNNVSLVPTHQGYVEITSSPSTTFITSGFSLFRIYKVLGYK